MITGQKPTSAEDLRLSSPGTTIKSSHDSQGIALEEANAKTVRHTIAPEGEKAQDSSLSNIYVTRRPGYVANRRCAFFAVCREDTDVNGQSATVGDGTGSAIKTPLALKSASKIRLSMSIDGKARVTTGNESLAEARPLAETATKPRVRAGLQRSQSAMEPTNPSLAFSRRSMTGRSRDARTWEFYCDSDAGNALTQQAEREQSGSAIGPIGLIRSRSSNTMAQTTNKRNANMSQQEPTKRQKSDGQLTGKPKFGRAMSSVARLQSVTSNMQKQHAKAVDKSSKPKIQPDLDDSTSGDSDKENWVPGTHRRYIRATNSMDSRRPRWVLEQNYSMPSEENVTPRTSNPKAKASPQRPPTLVVDDVFTSFKGEADEPREGSEDLDCVQSLLSLSQAAWE